MYTGILALAVYIAVILAWALLIKRNMAEGMLVGLLVICLFGGSQFFTLLWSGIVSAAENEVLFASLMFILVSFLMAESGIIHGILNIFNAMLGRVKGAPAFLNIAISAVFGMVSGSNSANTATSGSFTVQWMLDTGWKPETVATLVAGNGGLGAGFPPSASMFIMLGFARVAEVITEGELYLGLFVAGMYQVFYRIGLVYFLMRKQDIKMPAENVALPFIPIFKRNWKSLLIFLGALIPIIITIGPVSQWFMDHQLTEGIETISLLSWIPTLMSFFILVLGWKNLKGKIFNVSYCTEKLFPKFKTIGGVLLFAFAASDVLAKIGLASDLVTLFETLALPKGLMVALVALLIVLVAGPLSSTATLTTVGLISFLGLISVGVSPLPAVVAILVFASTEGASPPTSGSIFIASSLAQVSPEKTFVPLIVYFVLPVMLIGWLIAMGYLPLFV